MKITGNTDLAAILSSKALKPYSESDLLQKPSSVRPPRRKNRNPGFSGAGVRLRRDGASGGRRSRPETPLLRWKYEDVGRDVAVEEEEEKLPPEGVVGRRSGRKVRRGREAPVSARKLAAGLWRLQLPEGAVGEGQRQCQPKTDQLGFQYEVGHGGKFYGSEVKDPMQSSHAISGPRNEFLRKFSNSAMEGATKWDPVGTRTLDELQLIRSQSKPLDEQIGALSVISALKVELKQAQTRIHELETERESSKKKLEHFLRKVSEERATWRSREHEKIRSVIDDIKAELNRERKNRQRMEIVNSKLVNELADAKLTAKRFMQDYEKERKEREYIEELCEELAKELGEDKAEVEALKRESMKFREDVEEERKMLQMAEVWREERVQMKLVDAKVALEEKYSQMNKLVAELETFLSSRDPTPDTEQMRKAEFLRQAAAAINIQEIKEFTYEPPNSDDIFSILEDVNFGENNDREIEQCGAFSPVSHASKIHTVSPEVNMYSKESLQRHSNSYHNRRDDIEDDDGSGWETVSHPEDQGSNYSPEESEISVNKSRRYSNASGSRMEWEENGGEESPITEISEVCSVPRMQLKKVSSISRLWRSGSNNGDNYKSFPADGIKGRFSADGIKGRFSNARLPNGAVISPDRGSGKSGISASDFVGQWSSPDSANPHINRGMKGCIEWPRGAQKSSLKAKLLEARMETQKIQLRHVLKQRS